MAKRTPIRTGIVRSVIGRTAHHSSQVLCSLELTGFIVRLSPLGTHLSTPRKTSLNLPDAGITSFL